MKKIQQSFQCLVLLSIAVIALPAKAQTNQWVWQSGSSTINQAGTYGTQGTAAAANTPGARESSVSWTDGSSNLWLFGGHEGYANGSIYQNIDRSDLWKYEISSGNWTWVKGSNTTNQAGIYGTQGTPAATNTPGALSRSVGWADGIGNLWLFGGLGYASGSNYNYQNDLWKYELSSGNWTWVKGSNTTSHAGIYGTQGTPAATNLPGDRYQSASWADGSGNLWLFGGYGNDIGGSFGELNDLWRYNNCTAPSLPAAKPSLPTKPLVCSPVFESCLKPTAPLPVPCCRMAPAR